MIRFLRWLLFPYSYVRRSFYRKLLLAFFFTSTLSIVSVGWIYYYQMSSVIKQNAISTMERLSDQSVKTMETNMNHISREALNYFGDSDFQQFVKSMQDDREINNYYYGKFSRFALDNPLIDVILVDDLNQTPGISVGRSRYYGNAEQIGFFENERQRLQKIAIENNGKAAWVLSHIYNQGASPSLNTITFIQALKELKLMQQKNIGVLTIELSLDELRKWLQIVEGKDQKNFYLVNKQDGMIVMALNDNLFGKRIFDNAPALAELNKAREGSHIFIKDHGEQSLVVYQDLSNTEWALVGKVPVKVLLRPINDLAKRTLVIGMISLLGSMLFASLLSSMVIVPLKRLRISMKHIENGNYNISVPIETKDEIGYLSISFNKMVREINRLIVIVYETELIKKDAEIKALQSQINPHFLYNTLSTIDCLAANQNDNRINVISRSLAKMFRYNISGGRMAALKEEIQQILLYLSIQKIRYESRLNFSVEVEPELEQMIVPKLLIQPIIENSIIHGIEYLPSGGSVRIQVVSVGEREAEIRIWDNGKGMSAGKRNEIQALLDAWSPMSYQTPYKESSIGLMNVQARIKLVYGNQYGITIRSEPDFGTEVKIRLIK